MKHGNGGYTSGCRCDICRRVPAVGTVRRVRALMAVGWTAERISEGAGLNPITLDRLAVGQDVVTGRTHWAVVEFFRDHWQGPETLDQRSRAVMTMARRRGFYPALAWGDIDDPDEKPKGVAA